MKPIIYIVEGPDCSGKTTLSKFLANFIANREYPVLTASGEFSGKVRHGRAAYFRCYGERVLFPAMSTIQTMVMENAEWCVRELGMSYVLDRHWPSEHVYGRILRPEMVPQFNHAFFEERMRELGAVYIHCNGPGVAARHDTQQDPKHPYDRKTFEKIVEGYHELFRELHEGANNVVGYDLDASGGDLAGYCAQLTNEPE